MSKLHPEILDDRRRLVWETLKELPSGGVLAGGTALAIQIGHRRSYDFDVFYDSPIQKAWLPLLKKIYGNTLKRPVVDNPPDELTVLLHPDIKLTLLHFPFPPLHPGVKTVSVPLCDVRDIASSKAYAIGRRGVWRDYVDVYFLLRDHVKLVSIIREAKKRFGGAFSEKLFLEQLQYFDDLKDFSLEFIGKPVLKITIERALTASVQAHVQERL